MDAIHCQIDRIFDGGCLVSTSTFLILALKTLDQYHIVVYNIGCQRVSGEVHNCEVSTEHK